MANFLSPCPGSPFYNADHNFYSYLINATFMGPKDLVRYCISLSLKIYQVVRLVHRTYLCKDTKFGSNIQIMISTMENV